MTFSVMVNDASTSILLPMVGYRHVPMVLKRTVLLDLAKYEYQPSRNDVKEGKKGK